MIKDFEKYDKEKIENIITQRRESSRGGVNHNSDRFYTSLCGMINAFFRESNEHQYEDISGFSKILCKRIKTTVCEEADRIYKDSDYIATYVILAHYILNDICNNVVVKENEYKDFAEYDGYILCTIDRNENDSNISDLSFFTIFNKNIPEEYKDKSIFVLVKKLHGIILKWISIYKEKEIEDNKTFEEPKEYFKEHLESKLHDMFVLPKESNIEAYKIDTVR